MVSERISILLMDQDADTLEQLQPMLQREGYHVLVAADGHAALRLAKREKPNLIVSDLLLAGLDGYEVWQIIKTDKDIPNIPIVVISSLAIPPRNEAWRPNPNSEWRLLSYDAILPKPVDLPRFVRVVKRLLHPDQAKTIPGGPSVMVGIEDNDIRTELAAILHDHDFGVETRSSLAETLKSINAGPPAVLLLDYRDQNKVVKNIVTQTKETFPGTVIVLVVDPGKKIESELTDWCNGFLSPPLYPMYVTMVINQVLELFTMARRTQMLSTQLITTNRDLLDTQHVLRAQNEELTHINAQLRELDILKETVTSMVVHDLKAPLAAVLGALSFLSTDPNLDLTEANESLLTGAMAAANQMVRLTETLLEGQRLENGRLEPSVEPFDYPTVVHVSLQQISPLLRLHRLNVETIVPDDLPLVLADPHISQRILENLLDNAVKFSPPNSTITLRLVHENNLIETSVEDTGPGIPQDQQAKIFKQYAQITNVAKSTTRRGFGLGLTFCHLATEAMGGSIWVESDGESGTKFLFTLTTFEDEL